MTVNEPFQCRSMKGAGPKGAIESGTAGREQWDVITFIRIRWWQLEAPADDPLPDGDVGNGR